MPSVKVEQHYIMMIQYLTLISLKNIPKSFTVVLISQLRVAHHVNVDSCCSAVHLGHVLQFCLTSFIGASGVYQIWSDDAVFR